MGNNPISHEYRRENGAYTLCSVNNRMYWVHWEWDWQEDYWNISYEYVCTHEFWKLGGYRLAEDSWCIPGSDRSGAWYTLCRVEDGMYWVHWEWDGQRDYWNICYEYVCKHQNWTKEDQRLPEDSWWIPEASGVPGIQDSDPLAGSDAFSLFFAFSTLGYQFQALVVIVSWFVLGLLTRQRWLQ